MRDGQRGGGDGRGYLLLEHFRILYFARTMAPRGPAPPRPTLLDVLHLAPAAAEIGAALLRARAAAAGGGGGAAAADVGAARLACSLLRAAVDGSVKRLKLSGDAALIEGAAEAFAETFAARFPRLRALEFAPSPGVEGRALLRLALLFEGPRLALESIKVAGGPQSDPPEADSALKRYARRRLLVALAAAAAAGRCPALAALDLSYFCEDDSARTLLGCAPLTRRLTRLALSHCDVEAVAEALAAAAARGALPALAALRLRPNEEYENGAPGMRALRALAAAPGWAALEEVDLSRVDARGDPDGAALVGWLRRAPRLRVLRWEVSSIADGGAVDAHCISQRQVAPCSPRRPRGRGSRSSSWVFRIRN